jgi:hypothetical protein
MDSCIKASDDKAKKVVFFPLRCMLFQCALASSVFNKPFEEASKPRRKVTYTL